MTFPRGARDPAPSGGGKHPCGKASNRARAKRLPLRAADDTTVVPAPFPALRRPPDAGAHPPPRAGVGSLEAITVVHWRNATFLLQTGIGSGSLLVDGAQQKGLYSFVSEDPYAEVWERGHTRNVRPTSRVGGGHPDQRNHVGHQPATVPVTRRSSTQVPGSARCGDPGPRAAGLPGFLGVHPRYTGERHALGGGQRSLPTVA